MPERRFETAYWSDPFVMKLPDKGKLLYIYLWTNLHCNQAGLYQIAPETISFETGIASEEVVQLMRSLEPKVAWYPEQNLVWVKNFLRHQTKSPQFLTAAAKCLVSIKNNGLVREFLNYNLSHNLSIPYQYPSDMVSVSDSDTASSANTDTDAHVMEGKGVKGETISRSRMEAEETLCERDRGVISVWRSVKGFTMSLADASGLVARLRTEFPDLDILEESKAWAARKISEPLRHGSKPSAQIWNWMRLARKFAQERRQHGRTEARSRGLVAGCRRDRAPTTEQYRQSLEK